jgi:hypothetical protein
MNHALLAFDWTATAMHIPSYGFLLLIVPLVGLMALKMSGQKQSASNRKAQAWIPTGECDENGLPLMARERNAPHEARMRAAMAAYEAKNRH